MMKVFVWIRRNRATINGILITIFTSLIFNTISDANGNFFQTPTEILKRIFAVDSLSGLLTLGSLVAFVIFNGAFELRLKQLNKKTPLAEFPELMLRYTSDRLRASVGNGCLSWGEGKTVDICNDIIFGWAPQNVLVESYDNEQYTFYTDMDQIIKYGQKSYYFNKTDYEKFKSTEKFIDIIRKGNNLPRFMLTSCEKNFDKNNRKLLISLGRTEWSQTCYVWDRFGKSIGTEVNSNNLMMEYSTGITCGSESESYLPNSFCLHLIIESHDNYIVLSRISQSKRNDNPGTWAATLGEQIELEDFTDKNNFYDNFVERWMRRAFQEEYKFDDDMFHDIVNEDSFRVLSVDFESDRYNFSLLCTVQLRYTFKSFYKKVAPFLSTEEAIELRSIELDKIPEILLTYRDENERKNYHPSTYLRLLVFFIHKYGFTKGERKVLDYAKHIQNP